MFGEVPSLLRGFVPYPNADAELTFRTIVVDVDAEEVIGRHRHLARAMTSSQVKSSPFPDLGVCFADIV